jgi:molybdate transport system substrate-binding protein
LTRRGRIEERILGKLQSEDRETISVMSALAVEVAFTRWIIPAFEATSNLDVRVLWDPTTVLMQRVESGERADVIIAITGSMNALVDAKVVRGQSVVEIAQAGLGLAVKSGAPHPAMTTSDEFMNTLTNARAVAYSKGGASGIYFSELIARLGIADQINKRAVTIPAGFTAEKVASGEADLAVQQISELMSVEGVEVIGPFPAEYQKTTNFAAAVFSDAVNPEGAAKFIQALLTEHAQRSYRQGGLVSLVGTA